LKSFSRVDKRALPILDRSRKLKLVYISFRLAVGYEKLTDREERGKVLK
jgi:hypothetical protein